MAGYSGIKNSLAIEFDAFANMDREDDHEEHIRSVPSPTIFYACAKTCACSSVSFHSGGFEANGIVNTALSHNHRVKFSDGLTHKARVAFWPGYRIGQFCVAMALLCLFLTNIFTSTRFDRAG